MGPRFADYDSTLGPLLARGGGAASGSRRRSSSSRLSATLGIEAMVRQLVAATASTISHFGIVAIYAGFLLVDQQFFDRSSARCSPTRRGGRRRGR